MALHKFRTSVVCYVNHLLTCALWESAGVWTILDIRKERSRMEARGGRQNVPYEGGITKGSGIPTENQNSSEFVMWHDQIQEKQLLAYSKVRKWKEMKSGQRGEEETERGETGTNCYQIKFVSPLWRSAEEDELHYLATRASSMAWNPFNREKHNNSSRKQRFM